METFGIVCGVLAAILGSAFVCSILFTIVAAIIKG